MCIKGVAGDIIDVKEKIRRRSEVPSAKSLFRLQSAIEQYLALC